jgi:hypothetical protein
MSRPLLTEVSISNSKAASWWLRGNTALPGNIWYTGGAFRYSVRAKGLHHHLYRQTNTLGLVLSELNNPLPEVRSSAVTTGIAILKMKDDAASHAKVLSMIHAALKDPEYLVRGSADFRQELEGRRLADRGPTAHDRAASRIRPVCASREYIEYRVFGASGDPRLSAAGTSSPHPRHTDR